MSETADESDARLRRDPPTATLPPRLGARLIERLRAYTRRRWVRRGLWVAGGLVALLLLLRLLFPWILALVLDRVAAELDLSCEVDQVELSVVGGELALGGLVVRPREGGEAVLVLDHLRVDLAARALLRGRVHVRRLDLDGLTLRVERTAEGTVPLLERLVAVADRRPPVTEEEVRAAWEEKRAEQAEEPALPDLSGLQVDALRLGRLRLEWTDASTLPDPHRAVVAGSFALSDLRPGSGQPASWRGELEVRPGLDRLRVEGSSLLEPELQRTSGTVSLRGLRPRQLEPLLALFGATARAGLVEGRLAFEATVAPVGTGRDVSLTCSVEGARLEADGEPALELARLAVEAPRLGEARVELAEVVVTDPRAVLRRDPDGAVCVAGVGFGGASSSATPPLRFPASKRPPDPPEPSSPLPALVLGALEVRGGAVELLDQAVAPPSSLALLLPRLAVGGLTWDPSGTGVGQSAGAVALHAEVPGVLGALEGQGTLTPAGRRLGLDLALRGEGIDARGLAPWLIAAGLEPVCRAGQLRAGLSLAVEPRVDGSLHCDAALVDLRVADGEAELLALGRAEASGVAIVPEPLAIEVATLRLAGLRVRAGREPSGAVWLLGLRERAGPRSARPAEPAPPAPAPAPAQPTSSPEPRLRIGRVALEALALRWEDEALPGGPRALELSGGFELGEVVHVPGAPGAPAKLAGRFALPGVAEEVRFTGTLEAGQAPALRTAVEMSRVHLSGAAPYLAPLGIEPVLADGRLSFEVAVDVSRAPGELGAEATLARLELVDAVRSWVRLEKTGLAARVVLPAAGQRGRVELSRVSLSGLRVGARLLPGGAVEVAGLRMVRIEERGGARTSTPERERAPSEARTHAPPAGAPGDLPILALAGARAEDVVVVIEDLAGETAQVVTATIVAELGALELDPSGPAAGKDAAWKLTALAPGVVDRLELSGGLALGGRGARLSARLRGEGATAASLVERLHGLGLEPALDPPGQLTGELALAARLDPAASEVGADLAITGVTWRSGANELLGLDALRVKEVRATPGRVEVGGVLVERPRMLLERAPSGAVRLLGLALLPSAPAPVTTASAPPPPPPSRAGTEVAATGSSALTFRLGGLEVKGGRFELRAEREGQEPATLALEAALRVGELTAEPGAKPAPLSIELRVPGALEALAITGELVPDPAATRLALQIDGRGLSGERLGPWLGEAAALELVDGRLAAALEAELAPCPAGGTSGRMALTGLELREGEDGPALFRLAEVAAVASRLDAERFELSRLAATGLELDVALGEDGSVRAAGLALAPPAPAPPPAAEPPAAPPRPARRTRFPYLAVDALELSAAKVTVSRPGAEPVELGLSLTQREPLRFGGPQGAGQPPLRLLFQASAAPILSSLAVELEAAPLAPRPSLALRIDARGIDGPGLASALPELTAAGIEAGGLSDGRFQGRLAAEARPLSGDVMDWSQGLSGRLALEELSFRSGLGPLLLGLRRLEVDLRRLKPGDPPHVRSVEVEQPAGRLRLAKDARGGEWLHACGLAIPIAPPPPPPGTPPPPPPPPAPPGPPPPAFRLDHVGVSGIDLLVEDARTPTPLVIPVSDLEVDVDGLRLGQGPHPTRFSVQVGLVHGRRGTLAAEASTLAQEVRVSGELVLGDPITGRVKSELSDLRLEALAPVLPELAGGRVDLRNDTELLADRRIRLHPRVLITDVDLEQQEGGLISGWLNFSESLNVIVLVLRDEAGTIAIDETLELGAGGQPPSTGELLALARNVVLKLFRDAALAAPKRTAGLLKGVGGLMGIPGLKKKEDPAAREAVVLEFPPGEVVLSAAEASKLRALLRAMQRKPELVLAVRHDLGGGDLSHLARVSAPSSEDVRGALRRLEARRAEIERYRADAAAEARFGLRAGLEAQAEAAGARLALFERELGGLLAARDELSALLREGGDPQARARLREGAFELGAARLDAARAAVLAAGLEEGRVEVARPRFDPAEGTRGGTVTLTPRPKKE